MDILIIITYSLSLLMIFLYALAQLNLLINYVRAQKKCSACEKLDFSNEDNIPVVTIQLPMYNEMYVVERLMDQISKILYPKHKLEIQVLDDSTDESVEVTAKEVAKLKALGFDIQHIRREIRTGFKAGALKEGLEIAKGEYIAIFDADFLPDPDFLNKTIPYFKNEKIGVVQTRWGHINRDFSILTRIQAFALDAHFTLEQVGRNSKGHFINFNGTAGVWRKTCIIDAGNWEGDTLTEDLDLSYRSQLKGWEFKYLEDVISPAELPIAVSAAKSQQFRWNKGGAENFRKMKWKVLFSKTTPFRTKAHCIMHLLNSTMFLNVFLIAILSIPMLYIKNHTMHLQAYFTVMSAFVISTIIFFICYWVMYRKLQGSGLISFFKYLIDFFSFFTLALGFSFHNTIAVIEGHLGKKSAFIRTPKFNINNLNQNWKANKYIVSSLSFTNIVEGILAVYFIFGLYSAYHLNDYGLFFFHIMLVCGFGYVFINALRSN